MSFNLSGAEDGQLSENHEINVTPFIDVMLVLLIIFMVAAPLATVSVPVDLPASTAGRPDQRGTRHGTAHLFARRPRHQLRRF